MRSYPELFFQFFSLRFLGVQIVSERVVHGIHHIVVFGNIIQLLVCTFDGAADALYSLLIVSSLLLTEMAGSVNVY